MDIQQSIEQVAGILHRAGLQFDIRSDGAGYRLPFETVAVFVDVDGWGDGTVVTVSSPILQGIDEDGPGAAVALNRLNDLNRAHRFLKFTFMDGYLVAVADLLGATLRQEQLLDVVYATASAADRLGPELADEVGGLTYGRWLAEQEQGDAVEADDDIPF